MTPVVLVDESRGSVLLRQGRRGGAHRTALAIQQGLAGNLDESPTETSDEPITGGRP